MAVVNVTAIIVTRGDHDLAAIIGQDWPEQVQELVVWDNSSLDRRDLKVYGRYAAIAEASHELIYVQDDDCVLPKESIQQIIDTWFESGKYPFDGRGSPWGADQRDLADHVVSNMPAAFRHDFYSDHCLVGFGACFRRDAPARAFSRMVGNHDGLNPDLAGDWWGYTMKTPDGAVIVDIPTAEFFRRTCDVIFTALTPRVLVDVPYENLPWATDDDRMYRQHEHVEERTRMLELVRTVRDAS